MQSTLLSGHRTTRQHQALLIVAREGPGPTNTAQETFAGIGAGLQHIQLCVRLDISQRRSAACQAAAGAGTYGNLPGAPRRRLASSSQWQKFVLSNLIEGYYGDSSSVLRRQQQVQHQADVQRAFEALEDMSEKEARTVRPDLLRMLLAFCAEAMPEQSLQLLEGLCTALQPHPDLLVTLQYNQGCRDAIAQLLNAAANAVRGDANLFMRWLHVQRALNIYAAEPSATMAAANVRTVPTVEGVFVTQSIDEQDGWTEAEELLTA